MLEDVLALERINPPLQGTLGTLAHPAKPHLTWQSSIDFRGMVLEGMSEDHEALRAAVPVCLAVLRSVCRVPTSPFSNPPVCGFLSSMIGDLGYWVAIAPCFLFFPSYHVT